MDFKSIDPEEIAGFLVQALRQGSFPGRVNVPMCMMPINNYNCSSLVMHEATVICTMILVYISNSNLADCIVCTLYISQDSGSKVRFL